MIDRRKFPLRQGDLDWLCSAYAAINLCKLRGHISTPLEADERFEKMVSDLPRGWDLRRYIAEGVNPNRDIRNLMKIAGYSDATPLPLDVMLASLHQRVAPPGFLVYLKGVGDSRGLSHYTIVKSAARSGRLGLYDSYGFSHIQRSTSGYILEKGSCPIEIKAVWRVED